MRERITPNIDGTEPKSPPERKLFAAVILQAFNDATGQPQRWEPTSDKIERRRAREWLVTESSWLKDLRDLAGIDSAAVIARGQTLAARKWMLHEIP